MQMSVFEHSARNLSSGDITTAGEDMSWCNVHTSLFDSTVRTSMIPSRELVAMMVPSRDRATPLTKWAWGGEATCKSHNCTVLSLDADARRDSTGENWTAL